MCDALAASLQSLFGSWWTFETEQGRPADWVNPQKQGKPALGGMPLPSWKALEHSQQQITAQDDTGKLKKMQQHEMLMGQLT